MKLLLPDERATSVSCGITKEMFVCEWLCDFNNDLSLVDIYETLQTGSSAQRLDRVR